MTLTHQWNTHRTSSRANTILCASLAVGLWLGGVVRSIGWDKLGLLAGALMATCAAKKSHEQYLDHHENITAYSAMQHTAMLDGGKLSLKAFYEVKHGKPDLQLTTATLEDQPMIEQAKPDRFDWDNLRGDLYYDQYPHIGVVAPSGFGKTHWLSRELKKHNADIHICAVKGLKEQWQGFEDKVVGIGYNYSAIAREIDKVYETHMMRANGDLCRDRVYLVLDDFASAVLGLDKAYWQKLMLLLRDGREYRIRLWLIIQGNNVESWAFLKGQSDLLESLTRIYGGKFAIDQAKSLVKSGEMTKDDLAWLKSQDRACLVRDQLAEV